MAEIVTVILALAVAAVVVQPLIRPRQSRAALAASEDAAADRLLAEKEAVYAALKEMEFDYQIGKLTRDDYEELRRLYQDRAVGVLEALDALDGAPALDTAIEEEIEAEVVAERARRRQTADHHAFCTRCGAALPPAARFCPQCGAATGSGAV